jgi:hypothetical protein
MQKKFLDLSPLANYTERATADCRLSYYLLFADREECRVVSAVVPYSRIFGFLDLEPLERRYSPNISFTPQVGLSPGKEPQHRSDRKLYRLQMRSGRCIAEKNLLHLPRIEAQPFRPWFVTVPTGHLFVCIYLLLLMDLQPICWASAAFLFPSVRLFGKGNSPS